jgi:hypothetical protein
MAYAEVKFLLVREVPHTGRKRLLERPIISPFGKGAIDVGVGYGRLALGVLRDWPAVPLPPRLEYPQDAVQETLIAEFTLRTPLRHREVREDQFGDLRFGELDGNRRGYSVFCSCAHGSLASWAACGLYLLNRVSPNTTIA